MGHLFLLSMGKNTIHYLNGMMKNTKNTKVDFNVSFFVSLFGKMLFPCSIESLMLRHCHFVMCSCWNLGHCMIDYVAILAFGHFWVVVFFGHGITWTMVVSHEFWQCCWHVMLLNELWLEFWGIEVVKNLLYRLGWKNSWWVWKICWHVSLTSWALQNFVGMSMEKFCGCEKFFCIGYGTLIMVGFYWAWDFGYGNIFVGYVTLDHGKILWLWFWTWKIFGCGFGHGKFFGCDFGHDYREKKLCYGCDVDSNFVLKILKSWGSLQMLKGIWEILNPDIKNIINETNFQNFFQALLNQETHEYKELQLLTLSEWFWDTMCTFHFPGMVKRC